MIHKISIIGFKSHKKTQLDLRNLTVLCGANGVGKSSAIQSLLLLREGHINKTDFEYLDLLSNPIRIGNLADAIYYENSDGFQFEIESSIQSYYFNFQTTDNDLSKTLIYESKESPNRYDKKLIKSESLFNSNFQYISAARFGPQPSYPKDDVVVDIYKQISVIEGRAEYTVHYLFKNQSQKVLEKLMHPNQTINDLFYQTSAWEKEISEGVNVVIDDLGKLGYELKYDFDLPSGKTRKFYSSNVGFGITYVLPIIVAILSAKKDSLIIIENPEAHLHPSGISKLIELICIAAQEGVQIILETHSDHIINGILVQTKIYEDTNGEKGIFNKNVSLYQFDRDTKEHRTKSQKVEIEQGGIIRYAPKGFFDQFTIDRRFLMGF